MANKEFTLTEDEMLEVLAQRRGFATVRQYLISLLARDAEQHGEAPPIAEDDELDDPVESFRRAWDDAMNGRVMSWDEFRRQMENDAS